MVSVTPSTFVILGGNIVGEIHGVYSGGAGRDLEPGRTRSLLVSRERHELLLEQYDRSGMSGVKCAEYIGTKYSTLAYWLQSRRRKRERENLSMKADDSVTKRGNRAKISIKRHGLFVRTALGLELLRSPTE
jgi:hypothetical protein